MSRVQWRVSTGPMRRARFLFMALLAVLPALADGLPDPVEAGWQGKPVCEMLREDSAMRVFRCTFPPGVGHERHFHATHFGYALSGGTMRITDVSGTREVTLKTGSSFFSDGIPWHEVVNVGETEVAYLMVEPK
jgi:quercetin dioxygenase-like cupin family protein